jgi:4-amino-4-deoxy-L-arabinose transferase-like glycosyltransferase
LLDDTRQFAARASRWATVDLRLLVRQAKSSLALWEMLAIAGVVAVGAIARVWQLGATPYGISADEANVGLEAERALRDGWIGPHSITGGGQPTGVIYLTALSLATFGKSFVVLRLVPALAGILTVIAVYAITRRNVGRLEAIVAAVLLATSSWAIHFSRFDIPVAVWPLVGVAVAGSVLEALRTGSRAWWATAGVFAASGIYVYDAHDVFLVVLAVFLVGTAVARRRSLRPLLTGFAVMAVIFAFVALPMIRWVADHPDQYLSAARDYSAFTQNSWQSLDGVGREARFLTARYVDYWDALCCHLRFDVRDGTGSAPLARQSFLGLAWCGIVLGLLRRRGPLVVFATLVVVAMPLANGLSEEGIAREAVVMLPFLAVLAGVGTAEFVSLASALQLRRPARLTVTTTLAVVIGMLSYRGITDYYETFRGSYLERVAFAPEMSRVAAYMESLPLDHRIYFYSGVVPVTHEIIRFIAPDAVAEDRSNEFGSKYSFAVTPDGRTPVFVFMDRYRADVERARNLYPGGRAYTFGPAQNPDFIAYVAPASVGQSDTRLGR